jgi:hypothetical protein
MFKTISSALVELVAVGVKFHFTAKRLSFFGPTGVAYLTTSIFPAAIPSPTRRRTK